jgi:hypothetical protein
MSGLSPLPIFAKPASPLVVERCLKPTSPCAQTNNLWQAKARAQQVIAQIEQEKPPVPPIARL